MRARRKTPGLVRHSRRWLTLVLPAMTAALGVGGVLSPALPGAQAATSAGRPAAGLHATAARAATRQLLLINGDRLLVTDVPGGRPRIAMIAAPAGGGLVTETALGGLAIPPDALPYLGHGLDPSLFELSTLRRLESGRRLPVQVTFQGGRPVLPGVTVTQTGTGSERGYLTASSAAVFGSALARQFSADHARASYGADGLFAGSADITVAGAAAAARATPYFPMHTLTVTATDLAGKPDTGDAVFVFNVNNLAAFSGFPPTPFYQGTAKLSVPSGTYWAIGWFFQLSASGQILSERLDVLPQFTVSGAATVGMSEQAATSKITVATPRPSVLQDSQVTFVRAAGTTVNSFGFDSGSQPLWVSPTSQPVTDGTLRTFTNATLTSPPGASPQYAYDLDFPGPDGIIPTQDYTVAPGSLATVSEQYYQDVPSAGAWLTAGGDSYQIFNSLIGGFFIPLQLPATQVQYQSAGPQMFWQSQYLEHQSISAGEQTGGQTGAFALATPGEQVTQSWNRYPLHPAPTAALPGTSAFSEQPSAVRAGNTLTVTLAPFGDNQLGHTGDGFDCLFGCGSLTGSDALYQNGTKIAAGNAASGGSYAYVTAKVAAKPATMKFTLAASRASKQYLLSAASQDTWTWRSRPEPGATVPAPWACGFTATGPDRHCAVQPLLTLNYQVQGLTLTGTAAAGPQVINLGVGHLQAAATPAVTGATAQVSCDGGKTWQPAAVTATGGGNFSLGFAAPAGCDVTLRVSATDAAGGSLTETISRAYRVTAAAAPAASSAVPAGGAGHTATGASQQLIQPPCGTVHRHGERCFVLYRPQAGVNRAIARGQTGQAARPSGLTPQQIRAAYRLPVSSTSHQTVAVSIAYDTPRLAAYLAAYRTYFTLPACTTASGCLRIVNQHGNASPLPQSGVGSGWDLEATLDVSMISVACPHCKILVVEANSASDAALAATENTAARLGAQVISNSYGGTENGYSLTFAHAYSHPGHTIVVSSGDTGFGQANFPADLASVTAAGGTELSAAGNARGWTEKVWNVPAAFGAGASGCSAYVAKPRWQHDAHCPGRTVADVSAVAWNVPIYNKDYGGWITVGGTSVSAPLIAGIYGLAGNAAQLAPGALYQHPAELFDITAGNNALFGTPAATCGNDYLCVAKQGYDAPTGLGTPDGTGAF